MKPAPPHTSGLHFALARTAVPGKPYCGDPSVIDGLLRKLAADVLARVAQVGNKTLSESGAKDLDYASILAVSDILIGNNSAYTTVGQWNPTGLASVLREAMPSEISSAHLLGDAGAIRQAVTQIVLTLYRLAFEFGCDDRERDLRDQVEIALAKYTQLFVGR